jgi:hypothetical protein
MSEFRLIMISAMYENGGNTTHRMLDGHPDFYVYPFESQVGTGAGSDFLSSLVPIRYRWPEFPGSVTADAAYEMFWDEELKTLLRVPGRSKFRGSGLKMDEKLRKKRFSEHLADKPLSRANIVEAFFRATFDAWENYVSSGSETTYVGYNPVQVLDADKIFHDFPDAHILHVVRNPFSGYADTLKRPFPLSLSRYGWTWNICQHMALTYAKKYAGHFHILLFEEMVADPAAALGAVLKAMGHTFSEHCGHPSFNRQKLEEVYPWGTIRLPTPDANIATANELSRAQKLALKNEVGVMLPLLGYDRLYDEHLS